MPDFPDSGRALQDQVGDVFGQKCARHICWYSFDELRWNVDDEFVRFVLLGVVPCVLGMVGIPTIYFICTSLPNTILNMDTRNEMCRRNEQQTHNGAPKR